MAKKTLSFYYHTDCGACKELQPAFKEIAKLKGWKFEKINVENCKSKICDNMEYVPTVYVGKKKLNFKAMEKLLTES